MRNILTLALFILCGFKVSAQSHSQCREKCFGTYHANDQQRVHYFQYPSMEKYDVKHVKIDIAVEANSRDITGSVITRFTTLQPLDSFITELRSNMIVDSAFVNGTKLPFTRANDHVFIALSPAIAASTTSEVQIFYHGTASGSGVFAGNQASTGLIYSASLSESYQGREWFPVKQILRDKIDSADIWITTSATNLAGSNGLLMNVVDRPNSKKQFQWKTRYLIDYYLLSFAVANYMEYKNYAKPASIAPDSILIQHYIVNNPTYFTTNKPQLDKTPAFLEKMSELFSIYPFKNEKYGHAMAAIGGGMEHQTMSTMASFGSTLIAHELGHQWFGDNVTCATWNHIWINEGFASYSEYLMIEHLPALFTTTASSFMATVHNDVMAAPGGSVFVPLGQEYNEARIFDSRLSYDKGSAIIHNLRFEVQSDAVFYQILKNFQQQYGGSVATADNFRQVAETVSGKSLTDFFNQWYYGEGYPTFNIDYSKQGDSIVLFVNQTVSAPTVTPFFKGLYEFRINTAQGDTTVKVNMTVNNQTFKFRSNRTPTGVVVDPNNWVINKVGSITTGINDPVNVSNDVKVYPNPGPGMIIIKYPATWFDEVRIFDLAGQLVYNDKIAASSNQRSINTHLGSGIYVLQLNGKGRVANKKLVVVN